ncbi:MAG: purine-nucleoside phosphorylase [Candidatus Melainabacteria bacterium]|nr:purine-nucleoside phosphorylase [Candidatus Melainabacteria bacterium]
MKRAIILGSGLDILSGESPIKSIPYTEIPEWPLGKVKGHKGVLDKYKNIWVLRGRAHLYEGFTWEQACFPTQYLINQGIEELILTNAAGGIDPNYEIGDLMQITGYLNFMKPDKSRKLSRILQKPISYTTELIKNTHDDIRLHRGNYVGVHGPNYETHSEIALFKSMGASAVGMSTIPEIETAVKSNIKVTAISIITNVYGKTVDLGHEGVVQAAKSASKKLARLLCLN